MYPWMNVPFSFNRQCVSKLERKIGKNSNPKLSHQRALMGSLLCRSTTTTVYRHCLTTVWSSWALFKLLCLMTQFIFNLNLIKHCLKKMTRKWQERREKGDMLENPLIDRTAGDISLLEKYKLVLGSFRYLYQGITLGPYVLPNSAEKTIFHWPLCPGGPSHNACVHTSLIRIHTGENRGNMLGLGSAASTLGAVLPHGFVWRRGLGEYSYNHWSENMHVCVISDCRMFGVKGDTFQRMWPQWYIPTNHGVYQSFLPNFLSSFPLVCYLQWYLQWWWWLLHMQ